MQLITTEVNAVVVAESHNPSIVTKEWLAQYELVSGEVTNFVHTPPLSVVEYGKGGLFIQVDAQRLLVRQRGEGLVPEQIEVPRITKTYVDLLPHVPYTAHGVNFHGYFAFDSEPDAVAFVRKRFLVPNSVKIADVASGAIRLGIKASYRWERAECTLFGEPTGHDSKGRVLVSLNYHVPEAGAELVRETMDSMPALWENFRNVAANFSG